MATSNPDDVEVKKDDQLLINEFGKLNNRLLELRADSKQIQEDLQVLEDAATDVMMAMDGKVMLLIGEAFVAVDEDEATAYVEKKQKELSDQVAANAAEETRILARQAELKVVLYRKFGDSINLES